MVRKSGNEKEQVKSRFPMVYKWPQLHGCLYIVRETRGIRIPKLLRALTLSLHLIYCYQGLIDQRERPLQLPILLYRQMLVAAKINSHLSI